MTKHYLVLPKAAYICWKFGYEGHSVNDLLYNVASKLNYKTMTVCTGLKYAEVELFTVTFFGNN